jgi:hypothetical protein
MKLVRIIGPETFYSLTPAMIPEASIRDHLPYEGGVPGRVKSGIIALTKTAGFPGMRNPVSQRLRRVVSEPRALPAHERDMPAV